jgi:hypothetical protein
MLIVRGVKGLVRTNARRPARKDWGLKADRVGCAVLDLVLTFGLLGVVGGWMWDVSRNHHSTCRIGRFHRSERGKTQSKLDSSA